MIDAHCHRNGYPTFLRTPDGETPFHGFHPWQASEDCDIATVRARLLANPSSGVGEIGLDRLKAKTVSDAQRELFARQLELAAELRRPVVLHGAKCWGEVVAACRPFKGRIPAFLFHGFSRSAGLLPEIFSLNGYISVGPALLNDHAVNYRELVRNLPPERTLLETDMDYAADGDGAERTLRALHAALAALRGIDAATLSEQLAGTATLFIQCLGRTS
jgi:TatD DNase family protein